MSKSLTYKDAGVDTEKAAELVGEIAKLRRQTEGKRKLFGAFGLFAAGYDLSGYTHPVILSCCDGVGTKIKPLLQFDMPETAGVDLVGMNVNDVLTAGAMPLMFLDYIGINKLDEDLIKRVIAGISGSLASCDCILAGGETAEMPGLVHEDALELSGFVVGAAEKEDLIDPSSVSAGDRVFGVPSNGFHANGWSLVRRILEDHPGILDDDEMRTLLAPTRVYYDEVIALRDATLRPHAMVHITGGGFRENVARVLPEGLGARCDLPRWDNGPVQKVLAHLDEDAAIHTFNMGFGWVIIVDEVDADACAAALPEAQLLGEITDAGTVDVSIG